MSRVFLQRVWLSARRSPVISVLVGIYFITVIWIIAIASRGIVDTTENYLIGIPFFLLPMIGGCLILLSSRNGLPKYLRNGLVSIAIGLLFWGFGSVVYLYYNLVLGIPLPYPSLGEIGYGGAFVFWIIGLVFINLDLDIGPQMKTVAQKVGFFLLPFIIISISYYLFFVIAQEGSDVGFAESPLKAFFDILYPACDTLILLLLAVPLYEICVSKVKVKYKNPIILVCLAFVFEYLADFGFSYTTFHGMYFIGSMLDMLFLTAIFLIVVASYSLRRSALRS